jgi:Ca2+-transporting ATPase
LEGATLLGVLAFADEPTPAAAPAIAAMRTGGACRVVLLTGEGREAGVTLAREVGLLAAVPDEDEDEERGQGPAAGRVASAPEIRRRGGAADAWRAAMTPREAVAVVCRASPEDRTQAVAALEADGYVAAVTGNGAGDVAAMRQAAASGAGLGVVLEGAPGSELKGVTDMARGVARLVLREGDLGSLAACLREARRLYAGTQSAAAHALACHLALCVLWPMLSYVSARDAASLRGGAAMGALPLRAVHLLLLEALRMAGGGAGLPGAGVAEDEDEDEGSGDEGRTGPQDRAGRFTASGGLLRRVLVGTFCLVAAVTGAMLSGGVWEDPPRLPTLAFGTLLLAHPLLALNMRSARRPCRVGRGVWVLWAWLVGAFAFLGLAWVHPGLRRAMGLVALPAKAWTGVVVAAVLGTCWMEPAKWLGCFGSGKPGSAGVVAAAASASWPAASYYGAVDGTGSTSTSEPASARIAGAEGAQGERAPLLNG